MLDRRGRRTVSRRRLGPRRVLGSWSLSFVFVCFARRFSPCWVLIGTTFPQRASVFFKNLLSPFPKGKPGPASQGKPARQPPQPGQPNPGQLSQPMEANPRNPESRPAKAQRKPARQGPQPSNRIPASQPGKEARPRQPTAQAPRQPKPRNPRRTEGRTREGESPTLQSLREGSKGKTVPVAADGAAMGEWSAATHHPFKAQASRVRPNTSHLRPGIYPIPIPRVFTPSQMGGEGVDRGSWRKIGIDKPTP